jgi:hypothetical protein
MMRLDRPMNGHGRKLPWIKGDVCIKNGICLKIKPRRVSRIGPIDTQQQACQDRPTGPDGSLVFTRRQSVLDCQAVGHHNADSANHHAEVQSGRTRGVLRHVGTLLEAHLQPG